MSLRNVFKNNVETENKNLELTFEQYMAGKDFKDTEMLALESKVSDIFSLNIIDKIKSMLPFGKRPMLKTTTLTAVENIKDDIEKTVMPILKNYLKNPKVLESFEEVPEWKLLKDNFHLNCKSLNDVLVKTEKYLQDVLSNHSNIKLLVETNLTDTVDTKSLTAKQLTIVEFVKEIYNVLNFITDLLVYLADRSVNKDKESYTVTDKDRDKLYEASTEFRNKVLNGNLSNQLESIKEAKDTEIYEAIDNGVNVSELMGKTNNFIGNPIYHFRKFIIDIILQYSEHLRNKKNFLECILIEKQAQLAEEPENIKLQKQVAYYADKIEKIDAKIKKLEKI